MRLAQLSRARHRKSYNRRKKEEGRRKKEEGRRKKEEGRRKAVARIMGKSRLDKSQNFSV
jgi:hypothetical protein